MAGVPAFSSDESGTLQREAESHPLASAVAHRRKCLHEYYEVQRCIDFIQENGFKRVRLLCVRIVTLAIFAFTASVTLYHTSVD